MYKIKLKFRKYLKLEIKFDKSTVEPGKDVRIELNSKEGSTVSFCIIDKSVELLGTTNELTVEDISSQLSSYRLYGYYPPYQDHSDGDFMPMARKFLGGGGGGGYWRPSVSMRNFQVN